MSAKLENTALVLEVARPPSEIFSRRAIIALYIGVTLLYIGTFGWAAGVPWAIVVVLAVDVSSVA